MKVCEYCDTEWPDNVSVCSACGGNEFRHKCGNCGTVFDEGNFCPNCGVKAGEKAKKCPNCGKEYYSAACPDCGYTATKSANTGYTYGNTASSNVNVSAQTVKKRKTWLWVLGWIFIFPVPLTILIVRNQNLNKWVKTGIIAAAWIFYLLIGSTGPSSATIQTSDDLSASVVASEAYIKNLDFINSGNAQTADLYF